MGMYLILDRVEDLVLWLWKGRGDESRGRGKCE